VVESPRLTQPRFRPTTHAEAQSDYFDADVQILPGCGHWPMIDEPERVSELVLPFLRRQVSGEAQSLNEPAS
jgi:pimeloyl-ACP methyl ester carboxylesterase